MTVSFELNRVDFTVSGTRHVSAMPGKPAFDVHSVRVRGRAHDLRPILDATFLDRLAEAAAEVAEGGTP